MATLPVRLPTSAKRINEYQSRGRMMRPQQQASPRAPSPGMAPQRSQQRAASDAIQRSVGNPQPPTQVQRPANMPQTGQQQSAPLPMPQGGPIEGRNAAPGDGGRWAQDGPRTRESAEAARGQVSAGGGWWSNRVAPDNSQRLTEPGFAQRGGADVAADHGMQERVQQARAAADGYANITLDQGRLAAVRQAAQTAARRQGGLGVSQGPGGQAQQFSMPGESQEIVHGAYREAPLPPAPEEEEASGFGSSSSGLRSAEATDAVDENGDPVEPDDNPGTGYVLGDQTNEGSSEYGAGSAEEFSSVSTSLPNDFSQKHGVKSGSDESGPYIEIDGKKFRDLNVAQEVLNVLLKAEGAMDSKRAAVTYDKAVEDDRAAADRQAAIDEIERGAAGDGSQDISSDELIAAAQAQRAADLARNVRASMEMGSRAGMGAEGLTGLTAHTQQTQQLEGQRSDAQTRLQTDIQNTQMAMERYKVAASRLMQMAAQEHDKDMQLRMIEAANEQARLGRVHETRLAKMQAQAQRDAAIYGGVGGILGVGAGAVAGRWGS